MNYVRPEYLPFPITCPQTPHPERLIRDQRRDILLMRSLGFTYKQIASRLDVTERAVAYSCKKMKATPQHKMPVVQLAYGRMKSIKSSILCVSLVVRVK